MHLGRNNKVFVLLSAFFKIFGFAEYYLKYLASPNIITTFA